MAGYIIVFWQLDFIIAAGIPNVKSTLGYPADLLVSCTNLTHFGHLKGKNVENPPFAKADTTVLGRHMGRSYPETRPEHPKPYLNPRV